MLMFIDLKMFGNFKTDIYSDTVEMVCVGVEIL